MTDVCSANSFSSVTQISDPIIPDLCPIDLNQLNVALDITLPQIEAPTECKDDPASIWLPYVEPISLADYDPEALNVNIDAINSKMLVNMFKNTGKDVTFTAHFRLPDGTESAKDFTIYGSQTCELDEIQLPPYDQLV